MAFTAKILSWRFRHLNIVGCLLKKRPSKGGGGGVSRAPQDSPPLATPLEYNEAFQKVNFLYSAKFRTRSRSPGFSSSNLKVSIFRYFLNSK